MLMIMLQDFMDPDLQSEESDEVLQEVLLPAVKQSPLAL